MVSVCCLVYNHEKYLRQCLDGFMMQKTNFKFEVLIHDDASTDGSSNIIREYELKYPEIIKPIYQTENQYSKGVKISWLYQYPRAKGKYIALCEGDDYWINPEKLQMQFDYMESHNDCTLCTHEAYRYINSSGKKELFTGINHNGVVPNEEIIKKGSMFVTSSLFFRKDVHIKMPNSFNKKGFGDLQIILYNSLMGYCYYFKNICSIYNYGTEGSWTSRVYLNNRKRAEHYKERISLYKEVDIFTSQQYHELINKYILKVNK